MLAVGLVVGTARVGAALVAVPVAAWPASALGGVTGDVLGAIEQVVECTVLVVVSGLALHHADLVEPDWSERQVQPTRVARRVMPSTRSSSPRANENRP